MRTGFNIAQENVQWRTAVNMVKLMNLRVQETWGSSSLSARLSACQELCSKVFKNMSQRKHRVSIHFNI